MNPDQQNSLAVADGQELVSIFGRVVQHSGAIELSAMLSELKAQLEARLTQQPADYLALVMLGELNLRIGMVDQAQVLLYRASLLPPPSWEAYQRTSYLLRRAEERGRHAFPRPPGAPPPRYLVALVSEICRTVRDLFPSRTSHRTGDVGP